MSLCVHGCLLIIEHINVDFKQPICFACSCNQGCDQEFRLEQVGDPCQPQKLEVGQPNNYSKKNEVDQFGSLWYSKIDEGVNMTNMTRVRNYMSPKWWTMNGYIFKISRNDQMCGSIGDPPHGWFRGDGWRSMNGWKNWIGRRTTRHGRMAMHGWNPDGSGRCSQHLHGRSGSKRSLL